MNGYVVFRLTHGRWLPISRTFDTHAQAHRHLETLPTDWETEVREAVDSAAVRA